MADPDRAKDKSPPKKQFKRAVTITVNDQGSDSTREVTVDRDQIDTIVGLQTGTVEKVETAPRGASMTDDEVQDALNKLTTLRQ